MDINRYTVRLLTNGHKMKEYRHEGRTYVEAKKNSEYSVEIKNHSNKKVLAIVSVDGLDVIKGKPATNESAGYVINANDSIKIQGFRKDSDTVGSFKFTESENSYSADQGYSGNQGVISVRFFDEKTKQLLLDGNINPWENMPWKNINARPMPKLPEITCDTYSGNIKCSHNTGGRGGQSRGLINEQDYGSFDVGTTWGTARVDKSEEVEFKRGNLSGEANIYYASRDALKEMGVAFVQKTQVSIPSGFSDYATPPKGWCQ